MATLQNRNGRWRAMVRRKGHKDQYCTFPTKTAARAWAERIERIEREQAATRPEVAHQVRTSPLVSLSTGGPMSWPPSGQSPEPIPAT